MAQVARAHSPRTGSAPVAREVRIEAPSSRFETFRQRSGFFRIEHPDNWRVYEPRSGYGAMIAPAGGVVETGDGIPSIVCGVVVNHYDPFEGSVPGENGPERRSLEQATSDLLGELERSNPQLKPVRGSQRRGTVDGRPGVSLVLEGTSPLTGQPERVLVVTRELADEHVLYALFIAPGRDFAKLSKTFDRMVGSLSVDDRAAHR
jgi:hypothetical protein